MTALREAFERALPAHMELGEIREVIWRLMATGVISRGASQTEAELYDRGIEASDALVDLFELLGMLLQIDPVARTLRLFPPGADVPGVERVLGEPYARLSVPVSPELAASMLALWLLYREGVERNLLNEHGERVVTLTELDACLSNQFGTQVMARASERRLLLFDLRKHRVLRLPEGVNDFDADVAVAIQRGILSIVHEHAARSALAATGEVS